MRVSRSNHPQRDARCVPADQYRALRYNLPRALVMLLTWSKIKKQGGGVIWTKGKVEILGGHFFNNDASGKGGVIISSDGSTTILAGGVFEKNRAFDGGVVYVGEETELWVESGTFTENEAQNSGGVFAVSEGGSIQVGKDLLSIHPVVPACNISHESVAM